MMSHDNMQIDPNLLISSANAGGMGMGRSTAGAAILRCADDASAAKRSCNRRCVASPPVSEGEDMGPAGAADAAGITGAAGNAGATAGAAAAGTPLGVPVLGPPATSAAGGGFWLQPASRAAAHRNASDGAGRRRVGALAARQERERMGNHRIRVARVTKPAPRLLHAA